MPVWADTRAYFFGPRSKHTRARGSAMSHLPESAESAAIVAERARCSLARVPCPHKGKPAGQLAKSIASVGLHLAVCARARGVHRRTGRLRMLCALERS
jgi:hypothetical protein